MMTVVTLKCWGFVCKKHGTLLCIIQVYPFPKAATSQLFLLFILYTHAHRWKMIHKEIIILEWEIETFHNYSSVIIQVSRCILSASFPESHDPGWRKFPWLQLGEYLWIMQQMPKLLKNYLKFPDYSKINIIFLATYFLVERKWLKISFPKHKGDTFNTIPKSLFFPPNFANSSKCHAVCQYSWISYLCSWSRSWITFLDPHN